MAGCSSHRPGQYGCRQLFHPQRRSYSPSWGTCGEIACTSGSKNQTDSGASVAVGWKNDTWSGDIGTTPMGFNVVDVVGGGAELQQRRRAGGVHGQRPPAAYLQLAALLWRAEGQQQPYRRHLGGVRADGGGLSLSYDRGEAHGIWSSLGADSLTGKNVADNWRVRWMTGYYYRSSTRIIVASPSASTI